MEQARRVLAAVWSRRLLVVVVVLVLLATWIVSARVLGRDATDDAPTVWQQVQDEIGPGGEDRRYD